MFPGRKLTHKPCVLQWLCYFLLRILCDLFSLTHTLFITESWFPPETRVEMCVRVSVTPLRFEALPRQSAALTAFVHDTFSLLFPSVKLPSLATTRKSCHYMPCWDCVLCIMPAKHRYSLRSDRSRELGDSSTQNGISFIIYSSFWVIESIWWHHTFKKANETPKGALFCDKPKYLVANELLLLWMLLFCYFLFDFINITKKYVIFLVFMFILFIYFFEQYLCALFCFIIYVSFF